MAYFTALEANEALPVVQKRYKEAAAMQEEVERAFAQTEAARGLPEYAEAKRALTSALISYYQAVEQLELTGVVVKDLKTGLLDFPSKRFDQEVWLCWKYGEQEVKFWHEKDSGFMGRKPLEVSDEALV